ncbi:hypothetical protein BD779DRAFT_1626304 [Infundibulicybe gibba]|nr:hypothetical protein BD779DRAFT_1626304 [Infundibulicybe gibba]
MGSTPSKAVRTLPKRTKTPSWASTRTDVDLSMNTAPNARASERKTQEIDDDAADPHFLSNLNRLGPVRVDHHMEATRPHPRVLSQARDTARLFKSRAQSEYEASASHSTRNRLHAPALSELLDRRKAAKSRRDIELLANEYNIDIEQLERLARFVNSPSVQAGTAIRSVAENGEESLTMTVSSFLDTSSRAQCLQAVWVQPRNAAN